MVSWHISLIQFQANLTVNTFTWEFIYCDLDSSFSLFAILSLVQMVEYNTVLKSNLQKNSLKNFSVTDSCIRDFAGW